MPIIVDPASSSGVSVDLSAVFLNTAADPSDMLALVYAGESLAVSSSARAEVRQLVSRRRMIRRGGDVAESFGVTFPRCTPVQVGWLRAHTAVLLCVRDHVGTKFFGFYAEVPREVPTMYRDRASVRLQIESVTYSEAV